MRDCQLVSPADVLKMAVRTKGCDSPRIVLYTDHQVDWLTGGVVDVIKRQIMDRVPGLLDCTHEARRVSKKGRLLYMEICLPAGVSAQKIQWFCHAIHRVVNDQPKQKVFRQPVRQDSAFVNDRVRIAIAT